MFCNDRRAVANRENAKKSTGPRTDAGKARSRTNAFRHGLAGDCIAWPGELEGEMREFVEEQVAAEPVAPRDGRERMLVEKIARIAWMLDRAERAEEAQSIIRAAEAQGVVQRKRELEVEELVGLIESQPWRAMQGLLVSKKGCQWAIDSLGEMIEALDADWWLSSLDQRLDALCAPAQPGRIRMSRAKALALALGGADYDGIWPNGVPGLEQPGPGADPETSRAWSELRAEVVRESRTTWRVELRSILTRRLAEIEVRLDELNAKPDPALQLADIAATFDPSEQPERLRRYIRSRERERRHLMAELEEHRRHRDANPIECEPAAGPAPGPATEPPPTPAPAVPTPRDGRSDAGDRLSTPHLAANWVRSAAPECARRASAPDRPEAAVKPSR